MVTGTKSHLNTPAHVPAPARVFPEEAVGKRWRTEMFTVVLFIMGETSRPPVASWTLVPVVPGCALLCLLCGLIYSCPCFPESWSWAHHEARQRGTDTKPKCVGVVSLHFGGKKLNGGQKGTR